MSETETHRNSAPLVLVVDDDKVQRVLASDVLRRAGFAVEVAEGGIEGLEKVRALKPDLVMLDVMMPDLDGFGICRACQADDATRNIPILIVTGSDDLTSLQRGLEAGAKDFMTKPINWSLVDCRIRFLLRASEINARLREAARRASDANQAKSHFLATMSHELRTPLNAIIGFAEVLDIKTDDAFGPKDREYVGHIRQSGEHLLSLINDVLDISKIDANRMDLREDVVDPAVVIADCLDLVAPQAQRGELWIETDVSGTLPELYADAKRLRQVLLNLLSNAVKFTPKGGHVRVSAGMESNGGFALRVSDSGIGMSAQQIELAQQPFRQVENDFTRKHDGTGLGLPLALALARAHGGKIILQSEPNVGTTATLTLPPERVIVPPGAAHAAPATV